MRVDILPALTLAADLDPQVAAAAWEKARKSALAENGDRDDTRTFVLTVERFHQAHPFDYSAIAVKQSLLPTPKATDGQGTQGSNQPR